ncbi:MAG: hypothetical protein LBF60_08155 [Treponema sp.]|jgi:uncharacterized integral membrane protein|nr:hypothetical protein [Treponema sp.]
MLRLIGVILVLTVFLIFIGLNLGNSCDIRFWFGENSRLENVPVFLTAFGSFVLGMLFTLPFIFFFRKRKPAERGGKPPRAKTPGKAGKARDKKDKNSPAADSPESEPDLIQGQSGFFGID